MLDKSSDSVGTDALSSNEQRLMDSEIAPRQQPSSKTPVNKK